MTPTADKIAVTREDAITFLECACRNWSHVPKLSEDDIGDVATELLRFAMSRQALRGCQSALAAMIAPESIRQTTVLNAFAIATEAESKLRAILTRADAEIGEVGE